MLKAAEQTFQTSCIFPVVSIMISSGASSVTANGLGVLEFSVSHSFLILYQMINDLENNLS